jgi:hypothetical protein
MKTLKKMIPAVTGLSWRMVVIFLIIVGAIASCKKDKDETTVTDQPYMNMNDDTTTQIITSIPRIELTQLKSTKISLYLSVTDQNGSPFQDFNRYNFIIKQVCIGETDTVVVGSFSFSKLNQTGSSIVTPLVLDYSGSMSSYIPDLEEAVKTFITIKNPLDQAELIKFSSVIETVQTFTMDTTVLLQVLYDSWPSSGGLTAFYDAMGQGIDDVLTFLNNTSAVYLPAVIGFTDGNDNKSVQYSKNTLVSYALNKQLPLYTLGFGGADETVLEYIANQTGGRYYYTPDITTLRSLFAQISGQLRNVYVASWVFNDPSCTEVLLVVEASYTCANGTFMARVEKTFYPFK